MLNAIAIVAGIFSGWVTHKFGRKKPAIILLIPYSASWLLVAFSANYTMFLSVTCAGWFALFLRLPFTRLHVSEVAHPRHRGQLMSTLLSGFMAGSCLEYIAALGLNWKGLAIMNAAVGAAFALAELKIPESHVWLISKGRFIEGRSNLQWFYGDNYDVEEDFHEAENHFSETRKALTSFREIFRFQYLKPVLVIVILLGVRNLCGQVVLSMFMTKIFQETRSELDPVHGAIILGVMQLVVTVCSGRIIDVFGRRKALFVSGVIQGLSNAAFATYMYFKETPSLAHHVNE
jgi:MFS family permease